MPSELDLQYDAVLAAVTGRAIVTNFPATLPLFFDTFCMLNGAVEAVVAGEERLTFADLNAHATKLAHALVARGIGKGDRVAIAMRNCPAWIVSYMAALKAGAIATLVNGWWQPDELAHGLHLTEPRLVIADGPRAARIEATGLGLDIACLPADKPLDEALAPLLASAGEGTSLPEVTPEDDATILFTSGSTGAAKGAVSTHRAVTTGVYAYTLGLAVLLAIKDMAGDPPVNPPKTLVNVPLFHVTGAVPVMLNSFVIGRGMVLMPKWDPGEALRLIEKENITYFVGVPTMSLELMQHPDRDKYDLRSLTDIAAGGAARPVSHVKRLQESFTGAQPALGYGLTETNAVGCGNFWSNYAAKPDSTGRPQRPIVELAIIEAPSGAERARRSRHPLGRQHPRLLARSRGHGRRLHEGRLFPHRRHRLSRRGQLSLHRRPQEGHHHPRRREYQRTRGRGRLLLAPLGLGSLGLRRARRAARRSAGGGDLLRDRPQARPGGAPRLPPRAPRRLQAAGLHLVLARAFAQARHRQDRQGDASQAIWAGGRPKRVSTNGPRSLCMCELT
jgi:non-ribosomal peptide synthetase component F